mmetsp:Transcript_43736/g.100990  ORF Transcript_43736/g.100990 Transcript_43736/m.100990 type:complete len:325 (+) Transcript_43736:335-1309(+)
MMRFSSNFIMSSLASGLNFSAIFLPMLANASYMSIGRQPGESLLKINGELSSKAVPLRTASKNSESGLTYVAWLRIGTMTNPHLLASVKRPALTGLTKKPLESIMKKIHSCVKSGMVFPRISSTDQPLLSSRISRMRETQYCCVSNVSYTIQQVLSTSGTDIVLICLGILLQFSTTRERPAACALASNCIVMLIGLSASNCLKPPVRSFFWTPHSRNSCHWVSTHKSGIISMSSCASAAALGSAFTNTMLTLLTWEIAISTAHQKRFSVSDVSKTTMFSVFEETVNTRLSRFSRLSTSRKTCADGTASCSMSLICRPKTPQATL